MEVAGCNKVPESCHRVWPQGEGRVPEIEGVRSRQTVTKIACKA